MFTYGKEATCTHCSHKDTIDIYGSINVRENPELKERVKDGSLFVWECPQCSSRNLVLYETLYHDPDQKLMIWLRPESEKKESGSIKDSQIAALAKSLEGYTLRMVSDAGSLIEKVNILDAGLEDTVMELTKYVTKMEIIEKDRSREDDILDAVFRFYGMNGADNSIIFTFVLDGKMQAMNVGLSIYEDCRGIISRNPSVKPDEGFAEVDAKWLARFFR